MYANEKNGWSFDYGLPPGKDILLVISIECTKVHS